MNHAHQPDATSAGLEHELALLEQRQASLIAHTRALRAANQSLRAELAEAQSRNRKLAERTAEAARRLDALLARLPEPGP
jgi:septal ring factor EnvC (AmiA/AmiB activator)